MPSLVYRCGVCQILLGRGYQVSWVGARVRMPMLLLLPLDFRDSAATSIELACVLGAPLLWGDWVSPPIREGVAAAEVSMVGKVAF